MDIQCLKEDLGLLKIIDYIKYKIQFRREHPFYFDPCGTAVFCGAQGQGKTLSAVNYVYNLIEKYPRAIYVTNVALTDYPPNAYYRVEEVGGDEEQKTHLYWLETDEEITQAEILDPSKYILIEYDGLDCLKHISNGEYGVCFLIDELHLELNSLESKNIDISVMVEISQQRKQRKHIIGTSQIFMRLAKPLREQIADIVICRCFFGFLQFNKFIDGLTAHEENGKLQAVVKKRTLYFHQPKYYSRYDTYAKMKRYRKEWQGHAPYPEQSDLTVNVLGNRQRRLFK